jgi:hypothetical protein
MGHGFGSLLCFADEIDYVIYSGLETFDSESEPTSRFIFHSSAAAVIDKHSPTEFHFAWTFLVAAMSPSEETSRACAALSYSVIGHCSADGMLEVLLFFPVRWPILCNMKTLVPVLLCLLKWIFVLEFVVIPGQLCVYWYKLQHMYESGESATGKYDVSALIVHESVTVCLNSENWKIAAVLCGRGRLPPASDYVVAVIINCEGPKVVMLQKQLEETERVAQQVVVLLFSTCPQM